MKVIPENLFSRFAPEEQIVLKRLERQRLMLKRKRAWWIVTFVIFIAIITVLSMVHESVHYQEAVWPVLLMIFFTLLFFAVVAWLVFRFPERSTISFWYKTIMLRKLVPEMLPGWVFATSHKLKREDIDKSGLFKDKANRIMREDYLFGPAGKVVAEVYQFALQVKTNEGSGGGVSSDYVTNHFYGFFYRVHCPVHFPCDVWIFPKKRKISGEVDDWAMITQEKYSENPSRFIVLTGDTAFEEKFVAYTNDPVLSKEILTAERRQNLLQADQLFSASCAFSYSGNKVYAMTGYVDDPLDLDIRHRINEELFQQHAMELAQMKDVAQLISGNVGK